MILLNLVFGYFVFAKLGKPSVLIHLDVSAKVEIRDPDGCTQQIHDDQIPLEKVHLELIHPL